jgi:hypothetical protein
MNSKYQVLEEWRTLKCDNWSITAFTFVNLTDILSKFGSIFSSSGRWLDAPIDINKITFIRRCPEGSCCLLWHQENFREAEISRTIGAEESNL